MPTEGSLLTTAPAPAPLAPAPQAEAPKQQTPPPAGGYRFALPDDLREAEALRKYMGEDGMVDGHVLAKSYVNASSLIGRDKAVIPKTEEEWDNWFKVAGRPEAPDKYEFKRPEKLPDGFYNEDDEKTFRDWAHKQGLNQRQAAAFYDQYLAVQIERVNAYNEKRASAAKEAETALRRELGDSFDAHRQTAYAAFRQYADDDFAKFVDESGLGNNPAFIKIFGNIGKDLMGEDKLQGGPSERPVSPADLDKALQDYRLTHKEALMQRSHPENAMRTKEYREMLNRRYAESTLSS